MPAKTDEGFCVFGAAVLTRLLQALTTEISGVRQAEDIEYVHRMRVASRRLRAAMPLFETCLPRKSYKQWLKQMRSITRALGEARDTDVQMDVLAKFRGEHPEPVYLPGLRRLNLRLQQKRQLLQEEVSAALDKFDDSQTVKELSERLEPLASRQGQVYLYTPYLYLRAYESLAMRMDEFLGYEQYIDRPECVAELHAMRITAKRLRYTLEVFAPIYPGEMKSALQSIRKVQESLGDIHDCDVWTTFIPEFLDQEQAVMMQFYGHSRGYRRLVPGLQCFLEDRQAKREKEYRSFLGYWAKIKDQGIWADVLKTIRIPFFQGEQQAPVQNGTAGDAGEKPA